jgi:hypothetical protein
MPTPGSALPNVFDEAAFTQTRQHKVLEETLASTLPPGVRIGGAIMLLNGILQLSLRMLESSTAGVTALVGPWTAGFDVVVGGVLLSGQSQVWRWALVRLALGGTLLPFLHLVLGHGFDALLQVLFSAGLLLMMTRQAQAPRRVAGVALASIAVVLAFCAIGPMFGLYNPFGSFMGRLNGEIDSGVVPQLAGERVGYTLDLPSERWHVLKGMDGDDAPASTERPNGVIEELSPAVRRPDALADIRLFALQVPPEAIFNSEEVVTHMVEQARDGLPELLVTEDEWQTGAAGAMRVLEGRARIDGQRMGVALGFKVEGHCVFMLIGTAPPRMYQQVRDDLLMVFTSLTPHGCR